VLAIPAPAVSVAIVLCLASPAVADDAARGRERCAGETAEARAIDDALFADARRAPKWTWWWSIGYVLAGTGAAFVAADAPDDWLSSDTRAGLYVTAAKAYVGGLARVLAPLRVPVPRACGDDRRRLLATAARKERNSAILGVVGGVVLNTGGLLYLGLARDNWRTGALSFATGTVVGLVTLWTIPRRSWKLRGRLVDGAAIGIAPMVPLGGRAIGGLSLVGSW
jgi:hypothetical protein